MELNIVRCSEQKGIIEATKKRENLDATYKKRSRN
jgi:hypothetical protein